MSRKKTAAALRRLLADERGSTALESVLVLGAISIPLVMFLALLSTQLIEWIRDQAPNIFDEAAVFSG